MVAEALPDPALAEVNDAVLAYVPPELAVVELTTCAAVLALPATVAGPVRLSFGGEPLIDQPGSLSPASAQLTSTPAGKLSVTTTPVACGLPAFVSRTRKPI